MTDNRKSEQIEQTNRLMGALLRMPAEAAF